MNVFEFLLLENIEKNEEYHNSHLICLGNFNNKH
jgi:hypothetical protein